MKNGFQSKIDRTATNCRRGQAPCGLAARRPSPIEHGRRKGIRRAWRVMGYTRRYVGDRKIYKPTYD